MGRFRASPCRTKALWSAPFTNVTRACHARGGAAGGQDWRLSAPSAETSPLKGQ